MYTLPENSMGKILVILTVKNRIDEANAARGLIPPEQVRSCALSPSTMYWSIPEQLPCDYRAISLLNWA
jgi:hypothetical protein